jgi:rhodanese-related sulfurtransferase
VVAAHSLMNKLEGKLKGISSLIAKEKIDSGKSVFLDVRTPDECKQSRLGGCGNIKYIPLGQLRQRLDELGKDDEIVAFCKISLRGYEAALILEGEGFENVKVMEGGLNAWPFACEK